MPRFARVVIQDCPHHVTQRGNNRQIVFFVEEDYGVYLSFLAELSQEHGLRIDGYCLMANHVHLIATPATERSLALAVGRTHFRYTQYVNRMHGRSGHLWQNRFFSCPLDESHSLAAMAYVERNAVTAKLCRRAWRYRWSSAASHCGRRNVHQLADLGELPVSAKRWREALTNCDEDMEERIRIRTQTGRPLGDDSFMSKLEMLVGRRLRPLPVGRPRKETKIGDCPQ